MTEATTAPKHEISDDAATNRKRAAAAKSTALRKAQPSKPAPAKSTSKPAVKATPAKSTSKPAVKSTPAKSTSKPATERKPAASKSDDAIARHIAEVFATAKRGTSLKVSEIVAATTKAFPKSDERPPTTTISGRCRVGLLPEGIEGTASPRGARKSK